MAAVTGYDPTIEAFDAFDDALADYDAAVQAADRCNECTAGGATKCDHIFCHRCGRRGVLSKREGGPWVCAACATP